MFERECQRHGKGAIIEIMAKNLRIAATEAGKCNVKIALENVDRFEPAATSADLTELVNQADSPAVGFCLDAGHGHCCGQTSVIEWIKLMNGKLFTTHFYDNRGARLQAATSEKWIRPTGIDEHMPPGFGTIPWIDVIQSLWQIHYSDTVNFESGAWPGMDEKRGFECAINFWRTCEKLAEEKLVK
jgi:sugar phosphate isomerase/epimerase